MTSTLPDHLYAVRLALIKQVMDARGGQSEVNVRTVISRPLWRLWLEATGSSPDDEPTDWRPDFSCRRVYGSETVVIEHPGLWAVSELRSCD